jgi:hypothetical protein
MTEPRGTKMGSKGFYMHAREGKIHDIAIHPRVYTDIKSSLQFLLKATDSR